MVMQSKRTIKIWTITQVEFLKKNYRDYTCRQLAKEMNRSASSVKDKALKLGLRKEKTFNNKVRDSRVPRIFEILTLLMRGHAKTIKEISNELGLSERMVYRDMQLIRYMDINVSSVNDDRHLLIDHRKCPLCERVKNTVEE